MPHSPLSLSAPLWRLCLASRNNKVRITKEKQFVKRLSCVVPLRTHLPETISSKALRNSTFLLQFQRFLITFLQFGILLYQICLINYLSLFLKRFTLLFATVFSLQILDFPSTKPPPQVACAEVLHRFGMPTRPSAATCQRAAVCRCHRAGATVRRASHRDLVTQAANAVLIRGRFSYASDSHIREPAEPFCSLHVGNALPLHSAESICYLHASKPLHARRTELSCSVHVKQPPQLQPTETSC